jgi:hypothetical protein
MAFLFVCKKFDPRAEDQQRINTFSKLNTRHRNLQDKLEKLKVAFLADIR